MESTTKLSGLEKNYAYFRHIVDIPDMGLYEGGFMSINVATNNYGDHYINGIYVFGDMDEGSGHGAEYWNEEFQVYINYLNQGTQCDCKCSL